MKKSATWLLRALALSAWFAVGFVGHASADEAEEALIEEIATVEEAFTKAFNEARTDALVELFVPEAELISEAGNLYRGKDELKAAFAQFFAQFPGTKVGLDIESIRSLGPNLAIEEGTRFLGVDDEPLARVRYIAVLTKVGGKWRLASIREFEDMPEPTPAGRLEPLAWLIGDWVSEGSATTVKISYRWDDEQNFILGTFLAMADDVVVMKSEQRIGWDATANKVRSWMFDADGGFAQGFWTPLDESWVIKSQATGPEGTLGFATVTISPVDGNRFRMVGTDRIVGDERLEDFEVVVAKAPPSPLERTQTSFVPGADGSPSTATTTAVPTAPAAPRSPAAPAVPTLPAPPQR